MPGPRLLELARRLQSACLERGLTIATAESCTGGLIAEALTSIPGSSGYVLGGVVAYANEVKVAVLDVPRDVLAAHGAVSPEVAIAMADGARARLASTLAISTTGIAGPDGGSAEKPVGLVYVGLSGGSRAAEAGRLLLHGNRTAIRIAATEAAILRLIAAAEGQA